MRASLARGAVINLVAALTADGDRDIRNVGGSGVFVLSAKRFHPCPGECRPRNQFRVQIPYLRARRNRRFELIVDEPHSPVPGSSRLSTCSLEITNHFGENRGPHVEFARRPLRNERDPSRGMMFLETTGYRVGWAKGCVDPRMRVEAVIDCKTVFSKLCGYLQTNSFK